MPPRRPLLALAACLAIACCAGAPGAAAAAPAVPVGEAPPLPSGASLDGAVSPERRLDLLVALESQDPAGLESFATAVSTPGSPLYRDYLSVPEFASRFGATPAAVETVRAALAARGLQVGETGANDLSLAVSATAAEAEAAFGTAIARVETASGGVAFANRAAPRVPAAAAPYVAGVIGLDDLSRSHAEDASAATAPAVPASEGPSTERPRAAALPTPVATGGPQPCSEALNYSQASGAYTADQVSSAYSLASYYAAGDLGAGQTIALLEMQPFGEADIAAYQSCYGTHTEVAAVNVEGGPAPYNGHNDGESALDIEQVIGLAPAARVLVYQGPNPSEIGILSAWTQQNVAKVMSSSWGICEKEMSATAMGIVETLLQEAAAQGQTFFVASGDSGSNGCYERGNVNSDRSLTVDFPSAEPFATSVGGTEMTEATTPPHEYIWGLGLIEGAGGGGVSRHFAMPAYQLDAAASLNVIGPLSGVCGTTYCREVPDVSADAAPRTGYVVYTEEEWGVVGGTSASAPLWAAFAGLADASPACAARPIGFANPALYAIAGTAYAADFNDVTASSPEGRPNTGLFSPTEPYAAGPGYDMATGIGTPIGTTLGPYLCALAPAPSPPPPAPVVTAPVPSPPRQPRVVHAQLIGVGKGKPRLTLSLAAREGSNLEGVTITLPQGLLLTGTREALADGLIVQSKAGKRLKVKAAVKGHALVGKTLRIRLTSPRPTVKLTLRPPTIMASLQLAWAARHGHSEQLGVAVVTRETNSARARLPLSLKL